MVLVLKDDLGLVCNFLNSSFLSFKPIKQVKFTKERKSYKLEFKVSYLTQLKARV